MSELIENGERPVNSNPCYVKCPKCGNIGDYWQTGFHTGYDEKTFIRCLSCGESFYAIGLGNGCLRSIDG